jgi:hypothetical protein
MAVVYPTAAGDWSTRTWNDDATGAAYSGGTPQTGDTVLTNNVTITMDQNITIAEISNRAGTNATAGGFLDCPNGANGLTLTAEIRGNRLDQTVRVSMGSPNAMTIVGDVYGPAGTGAQGTGRGVGQTGTGQLTINGNVFGGGGPNNRWGVYVSQAGATLIVNGNATGGNDLENIGVVNVVGGSTTITINGNAIGGTGARAAGFQNGSAGSCTINGKAIHGGRWDAFGVSAAGPGFVRIQKAEFNSTGVFGPGFIGRIQFADVNDPDLLEVANTSGTIFKATAGAKGKPNLRGGFAN